MVFSRLFALPALFTAQTQVPLGSPAQGLSHVELQNLLRSTPSPSKAREWSSYYTWGSHYVGQGHEQAQWTQAKWTEFGIADTEISSHSVYLPHPGGQELTLLDLDNTENPVVHEASFEEDTSPPGAEERPFMPAFFAWSAQGNITAQYVYANFGLEQDFADLAAAGVDVEGKIMIIKLTFNSPLLQRLNSTASRFTQVASAVKAGAVGLLAYPDPQEDHPFTEDNGYLPLPDGPARPPSLIQRGTVGVVESLPGDEEFKAVLPPIPAIPISYGDAAPLLRALNGNGPSATDFGERWHGGGLGYRGVQYNVGPSTPNLVLNLYSNPQIDVGKVHNVIGTIKGRVEDEVVLLGNHRDTWGPGAGDSNSGSSALNEVVRSFGAALSQGWRPHRTIVFASWEGEEVGRVGSRAWLRENTFWANRTLAAYLNVVEAAAGPKFHSQASPLLSKAILGATARVLSPNQTVSGQTVLDLWDGDIALGTAGDAILFQGAACFPSSDFGFLDGEEDPVFPYHSQFDTLEYMDKFGDPTWEYHATAANIWALMAADLADRPVLPFNVTDYAIAMSRAATTLASLVSTSEGADLQPLHDAIDKLFRATVAYDTKSASLAQQVIDGLDAAGLEAEVRNTNKIYMSFERVFCRNLDSLTTDVNHLFVPSTPYYVRKPGFPHLESAIKAGNVSEIEIQRDLVIGRIVRATDILT